MSINTTPRHDSADAKKALTEKARRLASYLSLKHQITLKHTHALDVIAHIEGLSNRHVLIQETLSSKPTQPAEPAVDLSFNLDAIWVMDEANDRIRLFPRQFTYWPDLASELASRIHDARSAMRALEIANDFRLHVKSTRDKQTSLYLDALLHNATRERILDLELKLFNIDLSAPKAVFVPSSMSYLGAILILLDMAGQTSIAARLERNAVATLRMRASGSDFSDLPMPAVHILETTGSDLFDLHDEENDETGVEAYINNIRLVLAMAKSILNFTAEQAMAIRVVQGLIAQFYIMCTEIEKESDGNDYAVKLSPSAILDRMKRSK